MAKGGRIDSIIAAVPPPDKLGRGAPAADSDGDTDAPGSEYEGDEDKAAQVSMMQEFLDALGVKGGNAEEACEALDRYLDSRTPAKE